MDAKAVKIIIILFAQCGVALYKRVDSTETLWNYTNLQAPMRCSTTGMGRMTPSSMCYSDVQVMWADVLWVSHSNELSVK